MKTKKTSLSSITKSTQKSHDTEIRRLTREDRRILREDRKMRKALRIASIDFIDPYEARQASLDLVKTYNRGAPKYTYVGILIFVAGLLLLGAGEYLFLHDKIASPTIDFVVFITGIGWGILSHNIAGRVQNHLQCRYLDGINVQIVALQILHEDKNGHWPNTQIELVPPANTDSTSRMFNHLPSVWQARHEKFGLEESYQRKLLVNLPPYPAFKLANSPEDRATKTS